MVLFAFVNSPKPEGASQTAPKKKILYREY